MKNARKLLIATFIATVTMGLGSTLAWLIPLAKFGPEDKIIDGTTEGAFFAYGEGTEEKPFGISNPRHLYNLSWLQYLGNFSTQQFYFELSNTLEGGILDMDGWTIPPIGTKEQPFIGNFNGNGKVIENVVVSNDFDDFNRYPSIVNKTSFTSSEHFPDIVGFFGVIGDLNGNINPEVTYIESENKFVDTGLYNITVKTVAEETLVGAAAGYVNAEIANIAVDTPTINIVDEDADALSIVPTNNLSDYGVVGFTTKKGSISKLDEKLYGVNVENEIEFHAQTDGVDEGWGGSINMQTIFQRLKAIKVNIASEVTNPVWREYKNYYNGVLNASETTRNIQAGQAGTDSVYKMVKYTHNQAGNFNFFDRGPGSDAYMYLIGGHDEIRNYYTNNTSTLSYITDGKNYLRYTGSSLTNTTNISQATAFNFTLQSGNTYYISTVYNGQTYYLYQTSNSTLAIATTGYTNPQRQWAITTSGNNLTITNNSRRIMFTNSAWRMVSTTTTVYEEKRTIKNPNGSNWIGPASSGAQVSNVSSADNAVSFELDSDNYIYYVNNGTTLYLAMYIDSQTQLRFINSKTASNYYLAYYSDGKIAFIRDTYRIRYNRGWTYTTRSDNVLVTDFNYETNSYSSRVKYLKNFFQSSDNATQSSQESKMYYTAEDTTYFPLNVNQDGGTFGNSSAVNAAIANGNFNPKETNTGYIISGSDLDGQTNYNKDRSNIRVSEYAFSSISGSMRASNDSQFSDLLDSNILTVTYNPSNGTLISTNMNNYSSDIYPRYADSKYAFYMNALTYPYSTTRRTNANIYGLHFMDSIVNMDHVVTANNVSVLGNTYSQYQLPVNSINFHLKQKGVVNFFAGTYFPGNNSFFSLHQIVRNGTDITAIKEIDEIYTTDIGPKTSKYANIYKFKDGTYSKPYRFDSDQNKYEMNPYSTVDTTIPYVENSLITPEEFTSYVSTYGYSFRFKTSQIGVRNVSPNSLYYFEFPLNAGEYALGSVPGGTGAYLLYLDIGANASKTQRTIFYEHYEEIIKTFEYPLGAAIIKADTVNNNGVVDPTDTANAIIKVGSYGILQILRDDLQNEVNLVRTGGMITHADPTLIGDTMWDEEHQQYKLHDPGNGLTSEQVNAEIVCDTITRDVRIMQILDYNVNMETITITRITDISTNGGTSYERTLYQEVLGGSSLDDSQADLMQIFTNTGVKYLVSEVRDQNNFKTYAPEGVNNDLMVHLYLVRPNGVTLDITINLEYITDPNSASGGVYYTFNDYLIELSVTGGSITVTVIKTGTGVVVVGGTTISDPGDSITISKP